MARTKQMNKNIEEGVAKENKKIKICYHRIWMIKPFEKYCNIDIFRWFKRYNKIYKSKE